MPEAKLTHQTPTNIPIITSTQYRSDKPSLIPSVRKHSNGTPTRVSPTSASFNQGGDLVPTSGGSSFRALRSLLPFGPGKTPLSATNGSSANGTSANVPKSPFLTFGSMRRSMTGERKRSFSRSRAGEPTEPPIISIHPFSAPTSSKNPAPFLSPPTTSQNGAPFLPPHTPILPLSADLSTITEADNSGVSNHFHPLDDSSLRESCAKPDPPSTRRGSTPPVPDRPPSRSIPDGTQPNDPTDSRNDYTFNLSTSKVEEEVLDALMQDNCVSPGGWINGANIIVVDESEINGDNDSRDHSSSDDRAFDEGSQSVSFNFGELDPDLAALLSPNHLVKQDATITAHRRNSVSSALTGEVTPSSSSTQQPSRTPEPLAVKSQLPTIRHSFSSTRPPSSNLQKFRSVSGHSTPLRSTQQLPPASASTPGSPSRDENKGSLLTDNLRPRQPSPAGRVTPTADLTASVNPSLRASQSRLATPARYSSYSAVTIKRPRPRQMLTAAPPTWDASSTSPSSPGSSSLGKATATTATTPGATDIRLIPGARPSLDLSEPPAEAPERERTRLTRSRKRSMSLEDHRFSPDSVASWSYHQALSVSNNTRPSSSLSDVRPAPEWPARGTTSRGITSGRSLDIDRDTVGRSVSRLRGGSVRGGFDSEYSRSIRAPSRTAFSEASGPSATRLRGVGMSYTHTNSESGASRVMESPTFQSTTRTTFSRGSTTGTSVSEVSLASAQQQQRMQMAMELLKEKRESETEALLSALSDSQRTAKVLREDNRELREKNQDLEERLDAALHEIHRLQTTVALPNHSSLSLVQPLPRRSFESRPQTGSTDDVRPPLSQRLQTSISQNPVVLPTSSLKTPIRGLHRDPTVTEPSAAYDMVSDLKRLSTASSIFPTPPSNMAMLMAEEGAGSLGTDRSSAFSTGSGSPPPPLPHSNSHPRPLSASSSTPVKHRHNRSMSSGGEISPTTANFSMTEMTGSPGSLYLRPEHELHLGDMVSLDLGYHADAGHGSGAE